MNHSASKDNDNIAPPTPGSGETPPGEDGRSPNENLSERAQVAAMQAVDLVLKVDMDKKDGAASKTKDPKDTTLTGTTEKSSPTVTTTSIATASTIKEDIAKLSSNRSGADAVVGVPLTPPPLATNSHSGPIDTGTEPHAVTKQNTEEPQPTPASGSNARATNLYPPTPLLSRDPNLTLGQAHIGAVAVGGNRSSELRGSSTMLYDEHGALVSAHLVDEEALRQAEEERFQQRMAQDIVTAQVREEDTIQTNKQRKAFFAVGIVALLAIVIVILSVILTRENDESDNSVSVDPLSDREYLLGLVTPISGAEVLQNATTPQSIALEWLLKKDPMHLPIQSMKSTLLLERYILVVLYYSSGGPTDWADQLGFLSNRSICEWPNINEDESLATTTNEVDCGEDGTVIKIALESINVNGTLPQELGYLEDLEILSLYGGQLHSTIPSQIVRPPKLNLLQLGSLGLTGTLPDTFNNMQNMRRFSLYNNALTGTIPSGLFSNHSLNLGSVDLGKNDFSGTLPAFNTQSALERLWLDGSHLSGTLPNTLFGQRSLKILDLTGNKFSGTLAPQVRALVDLEYCSIARNNFIGTLPSSLAALESITYIDLSGNQFSGNIPRGLGSLGRLETLNLASNRLTGTLPDDLATMLSLSRLSLDSNTLLSGTVPVSYGSQSSLASFSVQNTSISGGLEEAFCLQQSLLVEVSADCRDEVECSCCTDCCSKEDGDCTPNLDGICLVKQGQFLQDEQRSAQCGCSPTDVGQSLECTETCMSCNADGTRCAQSQGYGNTFDGNGTLLGFQNTLQYVPGGNSTVGNMTRSSTTILFESGDWLGEGTPCRVSINGTFCRSCLNTRCASDFEGLAIRCDNIVEDPRTFDSCNENVDAGYLELFYWADVSMSSGCPLLVERNTAFGSES